MQNMTAAEFKKFFDNEPNMPSRVAVAALSEAEQKLYRTTATDLWLSRISLDEHKERHPEVTVDDYLRIPEIMQLAQVWAGHRDRRYLLLMLADKAYRAAIKIDASGSEKTTQRGGSHQISNWLGRVGDPGRLICTLRCRPSQPENLSQCLNYIVTWAGSRCSDNFWPVSSHCSSACAVKGREK